MKFELGIPDVSAGATLPRRLAWVTGVRLVLLTIPLSLVAVFYLRGTFNVGAFTVRLLLFTLSFSYGLAAVYAALLRARRAGWFLAHAQLLCDQVVWTIVVYLTGGVASGATSFYGLTCLVGAILIGARGAALAAGAGIACYLILVLGLQFADLPPPPDQPAALYAVSNSELVYYALINSLVLFVVALLAVYLAERLRLTGGELAQARERADQAERMAAMGRLATGLAHEIRNPLSSIAGSIQLLRAGPGLSDEDRELCEIVLRESARLNDLVTDMLDLSRPRPPTLLPLDLVRLVREVVELAGRSGRATTDVAITLRAPATALVLADGAQLRQLTWNLVRNAVQASSAEDEVGVEVGIDSATDHVWLAVRDEGVGLDEIAKQRLFDAFFTTRTQGTGVGLAVVKRIADDHGFSIEVESEPGAGATFRIDMGKQRRAAELLEAEPDADRLATEPD
ncbi:MAG TPA: ATP-binding protein [Polyangiaceae bacterium]